MSEPVRPSRPNEPPDRFHGLGKYCTGEAPSLREIAEGMVLAEGLALPAARAFAAHVSLMPETIGAADLADLWVAAWRGGWDAGESWTDEDA